MAKKYDRERDKATNTAKAMYLKATPANLVGLGAPPAPGSPDSAKYYNDLKLRMAANATPGQANRNDQNKSLSMKGLSESTNNPAKKKALQELLAKFKGRGGRIGGIMGGGMPGEQIR